MMDKYSSCEGCPDRCADPNCHGTCAGYLARRAEKDRQINYRVATEAGRDNLSDAEFKNRKAESKYADAEHRRRTK